MKEIPSAGHALPDTGTKGAGMEGGISITVNGLRERVPAGKSLSWLIASWGETDKSLIVERNGSFVYPQRYAEAILEEGDVIELINPDFGG